MHTINFNDLSDLEAEDLIREVWLLLEKHQIATPKLTASRRASRLQIALTFGSEAERATVAHGLGAIPERKHDHGSEIITWGLDAQRPITEARLIHEGAEFEVADVA